MVTYVNSSRLFVRTPSGAVGEAPDGPGAMQTLAQDVDDRLAYGGAEFSFNALSNIPAARRFVGKLAYYQPTDTTYRWVGTGNLPATDASASAGWLAWSKPAATFVPAFTNLNWTAFSLRSALWGIADGMLWVTVAVTASAGAAPSTSAETFLTLPSAGIAGHGFGSGQFNAAGSTANTSQYTLKTQLVGSAVGTSSTNLRIRSLYRTAAAAAEPVREYMLGAGVGGYTVGDTLYVDFKGPSGVSA
jgi:hypothetical protein